MRELPVRRSIRLTGFDYTSEGAYFVTVVTSGRLCRFGAVEGEEVRLSPIGRIVADTWRGLPSRFSGAGLDAFVVMPNHVHGILIFEGEARAKHPVRPDASPLRGSRSQGTRPGSLSAVMQTFKAMATRRAHAIENMQRIALWQRGFYDHVIRGDEELNRFRAYVEQNPLRWALDQENPSRAHL